MGNSPAGQVLLKHADALGHICSYVEDPNAYRLRQVCKICCEVVDRNRCVSTLVFPSVLVQIKLRRELKNEEIKEENTGNQLSIVSQFGDTGRHYGFLPHPCWGTTGEFVCCIGEEAVKDHVEPLMFPTRKFQVRSSTRRPNKIKDFIPVARLGSKWEPYRISVPGWLVQGIRSGKLRCLSYESDFGRSQPRKSEQRNCYEVIRCSDFLLVIEPYDEIRVQQEAWEKNSQMAERKNSAHTRHKAVSPIMGFMDCLALWMHPCVFPRLEELHITNQDLGMDCPSQMYGGIGLACTAHIHWSCWKEYASCILTPLLGGNGKTSCGLKKLRLAGYGGQLFAEILFDSFKLELPSLTHLEVDKHIAGILKGDWSSLCHVTYVDADKRTEENMREVLCELGKLPNLETLVMPYPPNELVDEWIGNGLYPTLRNLFCQVEKSRCWHPNHRNYPHSFHVSRDCPIYHISDSSWRTSMSESYHLAEVWIHPPLLEATPLPRSLRKIAIYMGNNLETIEKIRVPENFKIEEVVLSYATGFGFSWQEKLQEFMDHAPIELLNATKITLVHLRATSSLTRVDLHGRLRQQPEAREGRNCNQFGL